jgi:hypothetical protein
MSRTFPVALLLVLLSAASALGRIRRSMRKDPSRRSIRSLSKNLHGWKFVMHSRRGSRRSSSPPARDRETLHRRRPAGRSCCLRWRSGDWFGGESSRKKMRTVVNQAVEHHQPSSLIIDLRQLDCQFGDWIGSCCIDSWLRNYTTCWWQEDGPGSVFAHSGK